MPDTTRTTDAYTASLLTALGTREPLDVLRETPAALRNAVAGHTPKDLARPEKRGKWSARQVIQHLADSELVGGFRFRMVLAHDRPALPAYDQDRWASRLHYDEADVESALTDFATLRRSNLRLFDRATPADWERVMIHAERGEESLAHLIRIYAGHDLVHRAQLARALRS